MEECAPDGILGAESDAISKEDQLKCAASAGSFPQSTIRLAQILTDPSCSLEDVAEVIKYDGVLTTKLLRAASSAADGYATGATGILEAITRLGINRTMALAVASAARPYFDKAIPAYGLKTGELWRNAVAAAAVAEVLPRFCEVNVPGEVFTASLLHDVGKLVMGKFITRRIFELLKRARLIGGLSEIEAESAILKVNHAELGGMIAQYWQIPRRAVQAIIYHHAPEQGFDEVCDFTYITDQVARWIEAGLDKRPIEFSVSTDVALRVGLASDRFEEFSQVAASRYEEISRRYDAI